MSNKRRQILNAIKDKLSTISVANGFNTDIGDRVFYWHDLDFEFALFGAIDFRDPEEDMTDKNQPYQMCLSVEIKAIKFTENPLLDSCLILEDLIAATKDQNWNGYALKTNLVFNQKSVETAGKKAIRVMLKIKIIYRDN